MEQNLKKIMIALIVVVVALAGVLAYVWYQKSSLVKELTIEKDELTEQMVALQNDYATLSSDYDDINLQLDSSRLEVQLLIEKLAKTEATNRSKIRQVLLLFRLPHNRHCLRPYIYRRRKRRHQ